MNIDLISRDEAIMVANNHSASDCDGPDCGIEIGKALASLPIIQQPATPSTEAQKCVEDRLPSLVSADEIKAAIEASQERLHWPFTAKHDHCAECDREYEPMPAHLAGDAAPAVVQDARALVEGWFSETCSTGILDDLAQRVTTFAAARTRKMEAERQAALIREHGFMCEAHPGFEFQHDSNCPGPGMPWVVEGREAIEALVDALPPVTDVREVARDIQEMYRSTNKSLGYEHYEPSIEAVEVLISTFTATLANQRYAEGLADAAQAVEDFDEWVFCTCSECKADAGSHAVKVSSSLSKIVAAVRTLATNVPPTCTWIYDPDGYWKTDCGDRFCITEGSPAENRMKHCHYCGRRIETTMEVGVIDSASGQAGGEK